MASINEEIRRKARDRRDLLSNRERTLTASEWADHRARLEAEQGKTKQQAAADLLLGAATQRHYSDPKLYNSSMVDPYLKRGQEDKKKAYLKSLGK